MMFLKHLSIHILIQYSYVYELDIFGIKIIALRIFFYILKRSSLGGFGTSRLV